MLELAIIVWFILVALTVIGISQSQTDGQGCRHLISSNGVFLTTFSLYFVIPALNPILTGGEFFWAAKYSGETIVAVVMCALVWSLMIYLLGYGIKPKSYIAIGASFVSEQPAKYRSSRRALFISMVFILMGVVMKLMAVRLGGGMDETVMRMSKGVSQSLNISSISSKVGHLRNFSGISEAGAAYLLLEALRARRARWLASAIFIAVVALAMMTTGKRLYILWPVLIAAGGFSCYLNVLRPRHFLFLLPAGLAFGFLTLMYRIYVPLYFAGALPSFDLASAPWSQGSLWLFYFNSLEFSFFELTAASFVDHETINRLLGGSFLAFYRPYIEPFLYIIPRSVWPGKPETLVDISHAMSAMIFNTDLTIATTGIAPGLPGTSYILGGPLGFTVSFFLLGILCRRIDMNYIGRRRAGDDILPMRIVWLAFWIVVVFHIFRQGTIGWVFMITVVQQMGLLLGFALISLASRHRRNPVLSRLYA